MLTESDIKNFQALYERETGERLSPEEALDCAESLVEMIRSVYKPIKKEGFKPCTSQKSAI